ncbi:hypothetical protein EV1_034284 [Malus domestica]
MPTFVNPGGFSCLPATCLSAVRVAERVGKCITPTSSLGSLATFKVAQSPFFPHGPSYATDANLALQRRNATTPKESSRRNATTPEPLCTDTFGDWWEEYTQQFFGVPVETVLNKIFGDRLRKLLPPNPKAVGH